MSTRKGRSKPRKVTVPAPRRKPRASSARAIAIYREEMRIQSEHMLALATELAEVRSRFEALYDSAPLGYLTLDSRGVILDLNAAAVTLLACSREDALSRSLATLIHPFDAQRFEDHLRRAPSDTATLDVRLKADPSRLITLATARVWAPVDNAHTFNTVISDITERRQADQALRRREKLYREIVETAREGICITDAREHIVFANRRFAAMVNRFVADLIGCPIGEFVTDTAVVDDSQHTHLRRSNGTMLGVRLSKSRMLDDHGRFAGVLRLVADATADQHVAEMKDELMRRLVAAQEAERRRIARELHDQMGQHVVALSLGLAQLGERTKDVAGASELVDRLQHVADLLSRDAHHLAQQLRPSALDHLGLAVALTNFAEDVGTRSGIEMDIHATGLANKRLNPVVETAVYRIVQEAVTNVVRHANARSVSVIVELRDGELHAIVEDDGRGFDPGRLRTGGNARESLGVSGMHERATLIGGVLHIESRRGQGTTIYLRVPANVVEQEAEHEQTSLAPRR